MQAKNNFSSGVIFNSNYLVEPNNCINTHIYTRPLLTRPSRVIYNINAYTQRVCKNEWVLYAKQGLNNSQHKMVLTK